MEADMSRLFLPPLARSMRVLDRSFFQKTIPVTAAKVFDPRIITKLKKECKADILDIPHVKNFDFIVHEGDKRAILLAPHVKPDGM